MHDLDRTQAEYESDADLFEAEPFEEEALGFDDETSLLDDMETGGPLTEEEEIDLASELLSVSDDAELDQFLGKFFKKVSRGVRKALRSPVVRSLARVARPLIKKALPYAGGALGGYFGGPAGAALGSKLATWGGRAFGLELEGLSPEDADFEIARRTVRLLGEATKKAAQASPTASPNAVARASMVAAVRKHAPGLARGIGSAPTALDFAGSGRGRSGRWYRRGNKIIVAGA